MLLSDGKSATASSTLAPDDAGDTFGVANAFDEDIRTVWSATTSNVGEWLEVDLGEMKTIWAVQSNFAEQDATYYSQPGVTMDSFSRQYVVDASSDGMSWNRIVDRSTNTRDLAHDYVALTAPVIARYVKITNEGAIPGGGEFSVRDLRVFGTNGPPPSVAPAGIIATRGTDERTVTVTWDPTPDALGYVVRYGISADKLYTSYQVWGEGDGSCTLNSLNTGIDYYFTVDSFNEGGVTLGTSTVVAAGSP
jgi:xylan 1,4-beta-xylosidase